MSATFARQLAERLGLHAVEIADADRAIHHAAASIASNFPAATKVPSDAVGENVRRGTSTKVYYQVRVPTMHHVGVRQHQRATTSTVTVAGLDPFASRPQLPVVLRGGFTELAPDLLAVVPPRVAHRVPHFPRRVGTLGWLLASLGCAVSVFAVRDTMFTPLGHTEAPSAWEARTKPAADRSDASTPTNGRGTSDHDSDDSVPTGTSIVAATFGGSAPAVGAGTDPSGSAHSPDVSSVSTPGTATGSESSPVTTVDPTVTTAPGISTPGSQNRKGGGGDGSGNGSDPNAP